MIAPMRVSFPFLDELLRHPDFIGMSDDACTVWEVLTACVDASPTVRSVAQQLGLHPSTFQTRLARVGLPSAKEILTDLRLLRAGQRATTLPTVTQVAYAIGFSAPQAMGRCIRVRRGCSASEYFARFDWARERDQLIAAHYTAHRDLWKNWRLMPDPRRIPMAATAGIPPVGAVDDTLEQLRRANALLREENQRLRHRLAIPCAA